jgi:ApbE superfamily uncharacterized protein (UPF0280 family)
MGPTVAILPGNRLHLQHGPIDLIIGADGPDDQVKAAYLAARDRFQTILPVLVEELSALRRPVKPGQAFAGPVARRMAEAVGGHTGVFVTPMAAVAGSVADEMLAAMRADAPRLQKIWVNNGGDIAVHLAGGATFEAAMIADPVSGRESGKLTLSAEDGIGGMATSGRHGRSLSLGIADAVTVLAKDAAAADVAATLIANAVDLPGHPAIRRAPANEIDPDSDLGECLVVVEVRKLAEGEIDGALSGGLKVADAMASGGLIHAASLSLCGRDRNTQMAHHNLMPSPGLDPGVQARAFPRASGHPAMLRPGFRDQAPEQAERRNATNALT